MKELLTYTSFGHQGGALYLQPQDLLGTLTALSESSINNLGDINQEGQPLWSAIPSPWAKCTLLGRALRNAAATTDGSTTDELSETVLAEWMGLFAAVVLSKFYVVNLTFAKIDLDELGAEGEALKLAAPGNGNCWKFLYAVQMGGVTVGLLNPGTLIVPAADYSEISENEKLTLPPWFNSETKRFSNPFLGSLSEESQQNSERLGALNKWLSEAISRLDGFSRDDEERKRWAKKAFISPAHDHTKVEDLSSDFAKTCRSLKRHLDVFKSRAELLGVPGDLGASLTEITTGFNPSDDIGLYGCFSAVWSISNSDLNLPLLFGKHLVLSNQFQGTPGFSATKVWGTTYGSTIEQELKAQDYQERVISRLRSEHDSDQVTVLWLEDFFTEKICVFQKDQTKNLTRYILFKTTEVPDDLNVAVPLRSEILGFFDLVTDQGGLNKPDQNGKIPLWVKLEWVKPKQQESDVKVTLTIKARTGKLMQVSKTYSSSGMIVKEKDRYPIVGVWPNFASPDWKNYIVYKNILDVVNINEANNWVDIEPVQVDKCRLFQLEKTDSAATPTTYYYTDSFPLNFRVSRYDSQENDTLDLGLLLLDGSPFQCDARSDQKVYVAVDFGSTNTCVNWKTANEQHNGSKTFETLLLPLLAPEISSGRNYESFLNKEFLSVDPYEGPIPSMISLSTQCHGRGLKSFEDEEPKMLHAYLVGSVLANSGTGPMPQLGGSSAHWRWHSELKWSSESTDKSAVTVFLGKLLTILMARIFKEGYRKVEVCYSYPRAFSKTRVNEFNKVFEYICSEMQKRGGDGLEVLTSPKKALTESQASVLYFIQREGGRNAARDLLAVIDVGGSTSDITIYKGIAEDLRSIKLSDEDSVRFAGQDLLKRVLASKLQNGDGEKKSIYQRVIDNDSGPYKDEREDLNLYFNLLIQKEGQKLLDNFRFHTSNGDLRNNVISLLTLGVSGLLFYIGRMLESDIKELIETKEQISLSVGIGGNGSRLLDWIYYDVSTHRDAIKKLLGTMLKRGAGIGETEESRVKIDINKVDVKIDRSEQPKNEVVFGLLNRSPIDSPQESDGKESLGEGDFKELVAAFNEFVAEAKDAGAFLSPIPSPDQQFLDELRGRARTRIVNLAQAEAELDDDRNASNEEETKRLERLMFFFLLSDYLGEASSKMRF
ncbi:hypothetical protein AMR42_14675 [Limnothrix sp. PR1529]|uniref:hypothetical protein n=1 Tax=Limnothrix sp. PR1529 TaxID=1704291 RepID=UPI00081DB47E|nr:hypothetical protein [Limnothrix sp. PR1529]OCQ92078.1 hypothetical protein BCR12_02395 [Limnothrix sp. P13C2]PIB07097.1 hypothetical protein AMR42_14675 [Limnothrix sp. PR1529]